MAVKMERGAFLVPNPDNLTIYSYTQFRELDKPLNTTQTETFIIHLYISNTTSVHNQHHRTNNTVNNNELLFASCAFVVYISIPNATI